MAIDPVSAIAVATASYNAIVKAWQAGKQVESMSADIGKWMGAIADVKQAHQQKKTSRFKNVDEQALDTYAALKKAEKMELDLKNFLIANYIPCLCQRVTTHLMTSKCVCLTLYGYNGL